MATEVITDIKGEVGFFTRAWYWIKSLLSKTTLDDMILAKALSVLRPKIINQILAVKPTAAKAMKSIKLAFDSLPFLSESVVDGIIDIVIKDKSYLTDIRTALASGDDNEYKKVITSIVEDCSAELLEKYSQLTS